MDCFNQNFVMGSIFKYGFINTLSCKTNVLTVWKSNVYFSGSFLVN